MHGVLDKNDMLTLKVMFATTDEDKSGAVDIVEFKVPERNKQPPLSTLAHARHACHTW